MLSTNQVELLLTARAKNWFLKRRLDTNLCQVLRDVKYTRDWQLGLQKSLQDSVIKTIIFTTQKMRFSFKDLFNRCEQIRSFVRICSHLLRNFLTEKFIFCALICASRQTKNYCEEENNLFVASLFTFFEKNLQIFYRQLFRCKVQM